MRNRIYTDIIRKKQAARKKKLRLRDIAPYFDWALIVLALQCLAI